MQLLCVFAYSAPPAGKRQTVSSIPRLESKDKGRRLARDNRWILMRSVAAH